MAWSFPVGRLFGSELRVHATFFLLLLWVGLSAWSAHGPAAALESLVFIIALFACVIAHEFGHALTARRYGIKTPDITLLPIGGLARLEKMPENPWHEILVALAGPAVNVVIWAVLTGVAGVTISEAAFQEMDGSWAGFWARIAAINLMLALFNLLPAFPMDGGRVLRAALSLAFDRVQATHIASHAGQVLAFLLGLAGLMTGNLILLLIAFFVFMAAGAEGNEVAMRSMARRMLAREAMITEFETLRPEDTLHTASTLLIRTSQHEFPVVNVAGELQGFLTRNALFASLSQERPMQPVHEVMTSDIPTVTLGTGLEKVFDLMHDGAVPAVGVTSSEGALIGYITHENLGEMMVIYGRRPQGR